MTSANDLPKCAPHLNVPDSALVEVTRASLCVQCRVRPQRAGLNYASAFCSTRCRDKFRRKYEKRKKAEELAREIERLKASVEDLL